MASCRPLNARDALSARHIVAVRYAPEAAHALATPYVEGGLVVDGTVRRVGMRRLGRRWTGRLVPHDGADGAAGSREPRRPRPPAGSAAAAVDPPAAYPRSAQRTVSLKRPDSNGISTAPRESPAGPELALPIARPVAQEVAAAEPLVCTVRFC